MKSKYVLRLIVFASTSALLYGLIFGLINILYPDIGSEFPEVRRDKGFWMLVAEWIVFFPLILFGVRKVVRMARQQSTGASR